MAGIAEAFNAIRMVLKKRTAGPSGVPADRLLAIGNDAVMRWKSLARMALGRKADVYIKGIRPAKCEGNKLRLVLEGTVPNLIEHGQAPYDQRDVLLRPGSKNVRYSKKLYRYAAIPVGGPGDPAGLRTISENPATVVAGMWMHPGMRPANLIPQVQAYVGGLLIKKAAEG